MEALINQEITSVSEDLGDEAKTDYHSGIEAALKSKYDDQFDFMETGSEVKLGQEPPWLDMALDNNKATYKKLKEDKKVNTEAIDYVFSDEIEERANAKNEETIEKMLKDEVSTTNI